MSRAKPLTEQDWKDVFAIRCRLRRGQWVTQAEHKLCERVFRADPTRYSAMNADIFDAIVPFGSDAKAKRS